MTNYRWCPKCKWPVSTRRKAGAFLCPACSEQLFAIPKKVAEKWGLNK